MLGLLASRYGLLICRVGAGYVEMAHYDVGIHGDWLPGLYVPFREE